MLLRKRRHCCLFFLSMPYVQHFLNTHEQVLCCKKFTKITLRFCEEYYRM